MLLMNVYIYIMLKKSVTTILILLKKKENTMTLMKSQLLPGNSYLFVNGAQAVCGKKSSTVDWGFLWLDANN